MGTRGRPRLSKFNYCVNARFAANIGNGKIDFYCKIPIFGIGCKRICILSQN